MSNKKESFLPWRDSDLLSCIKGSQALEDSEGISQRVVLRMIALCNAPEMPTFSRLSYYETVIQY